MNEIATVQTKPLTAAEIKAQVQSIQQVMEAVMKPDVHYGKITGGTVSKYYSEISKERRKRGPQL
jgi:ABC-type transporter MlaC component